MMRRIKSGTVASTKYAIAPDPLMIPSVISLMLIMKYMGLTMRRKSTPDWIASPLPFPRNSPIICRLKPK